MNDYIPALAAILTSGGLITAVVALVKLKPEAGQIIVTAAQGAVVIQSQIVAELNEENKKLKERNSDLERENRLLREQNALLKENLKLK